MPDAPLPDAAVFIATSLDGFIARADGALDWLHGRGERDGGDYGYADFMASVDALVMGRKTFETVLTFGAWPFAGTRVVVLSSGAREIPDALGGKVEGMAGAPAEILRRLGADGVRCVYLDGGQTIQRFLRAGLVRELVLTRIPVLIGSGIPLFGDLPGDVPLDHVETRAFSDGLVQSRYRVLPPEPEGPTAAAP